ncbi:hypothetical protein, partial [Streptomyces sp. DfronAA-171]|uniref:hypothetical protein n=1 Tax=Streptomyces sp. DfronAA-171 TaxID=1839777 RepID=UPI00081F579C
GRARGVTGPGGVGAGLVRAGLDRAGAGVATEPGAFASPETPAPATPSTLHPASTSTPNTPATTTDPRRIRIPLVVRTPSECPGQDGTNPPRLLPVDTLLDGD